jgi:hypothetical protein
MYHQRLTCAPWSEARRSRPPRSIRWLTLLAELADATAKLILKDDIMSDLSWIRAVQYVATLLALLVAYAALSSVPSTRVSGARVPLELCAASKGALCDVSDDAAAPPTATLRTLRYRI